MTKTATTADQLSRLTLKSLKTVKWMSEETNCFTATVLLDGKTIGTAENDGHGGSTFVRFASVAAQETASAFALSVLPADVAGWEFLSDTGFTFDDLVDLTVDRELKLKEITSIRNKGIKYAAFITVKSTRGSFLKFKKVTDLEKCVAVAKATVGFQQMIGDMTNEEIVSWFMS